VVGEAWSKCVQSLESRCSKTVPCARRAVEFGEVLVFVSKETGDDFVITADGDNLQCESERERERRGGGGGGLCQIRQRSQSHCSPVIQFNFDARALMYP